MASLIQGSFRNHHTHNVRIDTGNRNQVPGFQVPVLDDTHPSVVLRSGEPAVIGQLGMNLDFTQAELVFPDERSSGPVRMVLLPMSAIDNQSFHERYSPIWAWSFHPGSIEVSGHVPVEFDLPPMRGSVNYAPAPGSLVLLMGVNDETLEFEPVGVAESLEGGRLESRGRTRFSSLDKIGFAYVEEDKQHLLRQYIDGEMGLDQLRVTLAASGNEQ